MERMTAVMAQLRSEPPARIGSSDVVDVRDLLDDDELPSSDVLVYTLDGGRVIVRPSGTEPKLKLYLEAVARDTTIADARLAELDAAARNLLPD